MATGPQKITVIGGSGFIGTRLCEDLANRQIPFEIIDLKVSRRFAEKTKVVDIRNLVPLRAAVTGDAIIHLAAVHRDDVRDQRLYHTTNVDGTRNVCKVAAERGIGSIVFTSTVAVYGFASPGTDERGKINPFNEYGRTKYAAEGVLNAWREAAPEHRQLIIVRPTVVFGEGNRGNVYNLLNQIASGRFMMIGLGKNRKSMAYVGNIAAFLRIAVESGTSGIFNYVDEPDYDMNALVSEVRGALKGRYDIGPRLPYHFGMLLGYLADFLAKATGKKLPISSIRVKKFCASTEFKSRKTDLEGFVPPFQMRDGLRRTLQTEFISPDPNREIFFTE